MKKLTKLAGISGVAFSLLAVPVATGIILTHPSTVSAGEREVNGPIEAVDVDNTKIKVNGTTYTIKQDAVIERDDPDGKISLSELNNHVGDQVELELDKENMVYRIELD